MPNLVNQMMMRELTEELEGVEAMVVVSCGGLDVKEAESLRDDLADKGVRFRMVRNRLAKHVLQKRGVEFVDGTLAGNTAIAYGATEATLGAAKVLTDKDHKKKITIKAGLLEGETLDAASAAALADVPDRDTLNAQLLGVIAGPARALATIVAAVPSATARVLQARADELEKGA